MEIILASGSERRAEILTKNNISFTVIKSDAEEILYPELSPWQTVMHLALKKGLEVFSNHKDKIIIAADTIVYLDAIIGKPRDREDAVRILSKLRATRHEVLTGVAIIDGTAGKKHVFYDRTFVQFRHYDDEVLYHYLDIENVLDKAGGYAVQGAAGALFVEHIEGDYDNVMGLPWYKVKKVLEEIG